jgi:hypothetical protein
MLGVLLCYNDGDLAAEAVQYLIEQGHDVLAWDHGSTDATPAVLEELRGELVELTTVPRTVDFYELYHEMSRHLLANYVDAYDWISWPDQDEFLEGPDRSRPYRDWLDEVVDSPYDWLQFRNFNYWWSEADDRSVASTVERVRHYSLFADCGGHRPQMCGSSITTLQKASVTRHCSTSAITRCAASSRCSGASRATGRVCGAAGRIITTTT